MRMKCAFSRVSSSGTPQPTRVSHRMTDGAPVSGELSGDVVEGGQQRVDVVAVDPADEPAAGLPFVGDRLDAQHPGGGSVGLQGVDVHQRGQVPEPVMARAYRGFPRRALVQFPVGEEVEDPRGRTLVAQPQRHPDRDGQAVPQRAAGDLHPRCVAGHPGHRQP